MESYSRQLGGEDQPLDLTLKVKQQQTSEDEPRPNQQEKPLCLIKSCVCNHSHRHEVPPHSQHLPYPPPHHPHGHPHLHHPHHHPHHYSHYTSVMTGDMLAANNRTPPPSRGGGYPYPSPYHVPVESRYDSQGLSPLGHHLSLPGFARGLRQDQQRQHMEVPANLDSLRSRSAPAPGCGVFPESAPLRERDEEHMDTEAPGAEVVPQPAVTAPLLTPFSRYAESQRLSPALQQPQPQPQQPRAVSPYDVVSSSRGRPNPSPRASPGFYGNNVDGGGDVVVSSNAGPDVDYGPHSPAGSCGGSSSDLTADSSSAPASLAASAVPRPRAHPRSTSFHIRNIISVVDDGHSATRIISRSSAAPPPDEQGPPSTTSTPPPSFQESRPQGAESSEELESPLGEDGKENLGAHEDVSHLPLVGDPGVTHMTALDYLISKVLVERIDVPYKPCNTEIKQIFTGQRKGRLRLVDLIELQVEKSLQA